MLATFWSAGLCQDDLSIVTKTGKTFDTIEIGMPQGVEPRTFELKNPPRIVIDFKNALLVEGKKVIDISGPRVSTVRFAQNSSNPDNVRMVIDLKAETNKEINIDRASGQVLIKILDINARAAILSQEAKTEEVEDPLQWKEILPSTVFLPDLSVIKGFKIFVAGKRLALGNKPYFSGKTLMVEAGGIFEAMGFEYELNKKAMRAKALLSEEVQVKIKTKIEYFLVNSRRRLLEKSAIIKGGKLYVPLSSIVSGVGYGTYWNKQTKALYIAPRITSVSWNIVEGQKCVDIETTSGVATFEMSEKLSPRVITVDIPNLILDIPEKKIPVKEDEVAGIKTFQKGGKARIGIYLDSKQYTRIVRSGNILGIVMQPAVSAISFTSESDSVNILISMTKQVEPTVRHFSNPVRIIVDIPQALYKGELNYDVGLGSVNAIRASQFSMDPISSRIVVDLAKDVEYSTSVSDDKKMMRLIISNNEPPKPKAKVKSKKLKALAGKIIVVDPGHGGSDPGTFGYSGSSVKEKELNLSTAYKLAKLLSEAGAIVLMTREDDNEMPLANRVDFSINNRAALAISMHYNSIDKPAIAGTETYYYNDNSKLPGGIIHKHLVSGLNRADRGLSKVKYFVLYKNYLPAVLVEPLYLSNAEEESLGVNEEYQQKVAASIFKGIKEYFEVLRKI